ncbi:sensor histidine kinase [Ktedonobacter racemifer]|uniref:Integral membrane sensor signal transduction histidine kinase n=1 Tax=Ktedonobacter racemifer DSM 44963 TaxID=485913 RepID=D6TM92_KTERA|nr:sensor histidine kinase [Ktedonobacter racemifer]EFH86892.1 integral membrane sensor signal transduction histidine kinase [Ktedonobacter racemifer DSM 44963]
MQIGHDQDTAEQEIQAASSESTAHNEGVIASSGVSFRLWRLYQHAWLVCLAFPLVELLQKPIPSWHLTLGLLALTGFAVGYTWLMWPHPATLGAWLRSQSRFSWLFFGTLSALTLVFSLIDGLSFLWLFIGLSALAGILFPQRRAFAVIVVLTLSALVLTVTMNGGMERIDWWWLIAFLLLVRGIGLDMIGVARMGSAIRELHTARRELARLAVIEERERLARDLHDLLGQTLSMISLKSELASCLIEEDPKRCAQELAEIEHVSRKTLRDVREAVAGYRQPALASELEGAWQLLEAAGITVQMEPLKEPLPPTLDAALAWTVREGVTNVIRHSRARQCYIRLTHENETVGAEILNDGGERGPEEKLSRRGLGLAGLRERISLLGGQLEAGSLLLQGKEHFRLYVELPFPKR